MEDNIVSVIVPTYKRDTYFIERTIKSILNQTYQNIEIVIVDDNGKGSEKQIEISSFLEEKYYKEKRIKYIVNENNSGGCITRNTGIKNSVGSYITFLDDDDEYLPEKIKNQVDYMINNSLDMSFTNLKLVNDKGETVDFRSYDFLDSLENDYLLRMHLTRHLTGTPTFMYKRKPLLDIEGFDDVIMGQEFFLMYKSIKSRMKIGYLNDCSVIAYRHNEGGISHGKNKILGEKRLFDFKKQQFHELNFADRRFVRFRHNAIMSVAYLRNDMKLAAVFYMAKSILLYPILIVKEVYKFIENKRSIS